MIKRVDGPAHRHELLRELVNSTTTEPVGLLGLSAVSDVTLSTFEFFINVSKMSGEYFRQRYLRSNINDKYRARPDGVRAAAST
jgi:hypothetical protein